jgi:hypothetical protein
MEVQKHASANELIRNINIGPAQGGPRIGLRRCGRQNMQLSTLFSLEDEAGKGGGAEGGEKTRGGKLLKPRAHLCWAVGTSADE